MRTGNDVTERSPHEAAIVNCDNPVSPHVSYLRASLCDIIDGPHCTRILHSVNVYYMVYVLHSDIVLRKRRLVNLRAVHTTCIS